MRFDSLEQKSSPLWSKKSDQDLRDQCLRFDSLEHKSTPKSSGPGLAIRIFAARIEPKILGTRACDITFWSKNWAQNLRGQGLRFDSLEHKSTPKSWGPGLVMSLFGAKTEPKNLGTRACDWTLRSTNRPQNLRDQGLRFDSLEHKSTQKLKDQGLRFHSWRKN